MLSFVALVGLVTVAPAQPAHAQLAPLPRVQLPSLPGVEPVLPAVTDSVGGTLRELSAARALRIDRLVAANRAELERDGRGELVVRAEVVAIDITEEALEKAQQAKFVVLRTNDLPDLGVRLTVLQTPQGMSATRGLKRLRKMDPQGTYDYNHVYLDSGDVAGTVTQGPAVEPMGGAMAGRVGLIDGGVDPGHQSLDGVRVRRFGCDGRAVPSAHGAAVASILVSRRTVDELFAADVYCGEATGGAVDAVAAAFGWMAREKIGVINVSLVGPRNALLERVIHALVSRGHVIVAAVGNDGPAAAPLFPAAYEGVIGVTGVDARHRVLIEACRGKQVDFAALGSEVSAAATAPDKFVKVRGTSFAAPLVAALLAEIREPDIVRREQLLGKLSVMASDLGKPGRDEVYGDGELGAYQ